LFAIYIAYFNASYPVSNLNNIITNMLALKSPISDVIDQRFSHIFVQQPVQVLPLIFLPGLFGFGR
jgi:hypothetical protein